MSKTVATAALFSLFIHFAAALGAEEQLGKPDNEELLALPWKQFDQTLGSGWRVYACRREHGAAAELIEAYLARRTDLTPTQRAVSHFHAAAELARENRYQEALRHLEAAEVAPGSRGVPEDWNELVISTRAFLLEDREALLASKRRVEAMRSPAFPHSAEGYLEHLGQRYGVWDEEPTAAAGCESTK
jgi:hypothetical protein